MLSGEFMSAKAGKSLEDLVGIIEHCLLGADGASVKTNARLIDRDTDGLREFDALITFRQSHHELLTAIECKDRSRPIGVPELEAFANKCKAAGVHKGIFVSSSGYSETALSKAKALDIKTLSVEEAQRFNWLEITYITQISSRLDNFVATIVTDPPLAADARINDFVVMATDGREITKEIILQSAGKWVDTQGKLQPGVFHQRLALEEKAGALMIDKTNNNKLKVVHILCEFDVHIIHRQMPLTLNVYQTSDKKLLSEAASAQLDQGTLYMVRNDQQETLLMFKPNANASKTDPNDPFPSK
jgi:hypothetical protein